MNKSIKYNEKVSYERKGERNVIFSEINKLYLFFLILYISLDQPVRAHIKMKII